jgi:hypothetical protein
MLRSVGWLRTDVSRLPIGPIFKRHVSKQPKVRNIPEDGRIQANRSERPLTVLSYPSTTNETVSYTLLLLVLRPWVAQFHMAMIITSRSAA